MLLTCTVGGGRTQQVQHILIWLHVVAVLVAAAALHLVAAGEPALQPLRPGPSHGRRHVFRRRKLTPVEGFQPFSSFTVTHMFALLLGDVQLVFLHACAYQVRRGRMFGGAYLKAVIPECRW